MGRLEWSMQHGLLCVSVCRLSLTALELIIMANSNTVTKRVVHNTYIAQNVDVDGQTTD